MIAKARSISHGSISIDYITRLGMAEIVKLNHIPKDVEVEAWWAHMQAHQMKFQYKRSKKPKASLLPIGRNWLRTL